MCSEQPGIGWWEVLPDVLAGLRMLPTHLGVSPFVLAHKQQPSWLEPLQLEGVDKSAGDLSEPYLNEHLLEAQLQWWKHMEQVIHERLA